MGHVHPQNRSFVVDGRERPPSRTRTRKHDATRGVGSVAVARRGMDMYGGGHWAGAAAARSPRPLPRSIIKDKALTAHDIVPCVIMRGMLPVPPPRRPVE